MINATISRNAWWGALSACVLPEKKDPMILHTIFCQSYKMGPKHGRFKLQHREINANTRKYNLWIVLQR